MYGLIGKFTGGPQGRRDELTRSSSRATGAMQGCKSYMRREGCDRSRRDISDYRRSGTASKESHDGSLSLASVRAAITRARPLIADMSNGVVTTPMGGYGL